MIHTVTYALYRDCGHFQCFQIDIGTAIQCLSFLDYDEKGFLDAQKRGTPHIHPKHHLDINFSNSSTFKSGLIKKISQQEFIDIVDNKKKRWFLKDER